MWHHSVRIDSPDIIQDFRNHFVKFDEGCRQAVGGVRMECQRIHQWLQYEQVPRLKQEFQKSDELMQQAKSAYLLKHGDSPAYGQSSAMDELKTLRKAERRREEAEKKLRAAKQWVTLLDHETHKLMGPINSLSTTLAATTPQALAKLDLLVRSLEEYLRDSPPDAGIPRPAGDPGHGS